MQIQSDGMIDYLPSLENTIRSTASRFPISGCATFMVLAVSVARSPRLIISISRRPQLSRPQILDKVAPSAYSYTFFNTSNTWGVAANQIGPGTTVHLCGGIYVVCRAAHIAAFIISKRWFYCGRPITLVADAGTVTITAPYWAGSSPGGPICGGGYNYIAINGDNDLILQATANGIIDANCRQIMVLGLMF